MTPPLGQNNFVHRFDICCILPLTTMDKNVLYLPGIKQSADDLERPLLTVSLAGTPVDLRPESVLHWKIHLALTDSRTVVFDLIPGGSDGLTGVLCIDSIESKSDEEVESNSKDISGILYEDRVVFRVVPKTEVTPKDIINLLVSERRDKYHYDDTGSGCRFWCSVVVGDLERKGVMEEGSEKAFDDHIEASNKKNPDRYPLPTRKGAFY